MPAEVTRIASLPPVEKPSAFVPAKYMLLPDAPVELLGTNLVAYTTEVNLALPVTSRAYAGFTVPTPTLPAIYAFPVVVAPPLIVRPPVAVPLPIVEEANAVKPFVNTGVCVSWYATDVVECARPTEEKKSAEVVLNALPVFCERKYEADVDEKPRPTELQ